MAVLDRCRWVLIGSLLFLPQHASANAGVPMLFVAMPVLGVAIVPIVLIEAAYLHRRLLSGLKACLMTVTLSNTASALIGIPLAWLGLVVIQMLTGGGAAYGLDSLFHKLLAVTWQAPWLIPYEDDLDWMVPVAGLVLLVPFFFASYWTEYLVTRWLHKDLDSVVVRAKVRNANLITYGLLSLLPAIMLVLPKG